MAKENAISEIIRLLREIGEVFNEVNRVKAELVGEVLLRSLLYSFPRHRQPSLDELRSLIREYMGLEDDDIAEYVQRLLTAPDSSGGRRNSDTVHSGAGRDSGRA